MRKTSSCLHEEQKGESLHPFMSQRCFSTSCALNADSPSASHLHFRNYNPLKELQYFPPCNHNTWIVLCLSVSFWCCFCCSTTLSSDHNYPAKYIHFSIQSKYPSQSLPLFHKHSRPVHFSSHFRTHLPFRSQSASEQTSA